MILGKAFLHERASGRAWLGSAVALGGVAVLAAPVWGELAILALGSTAAGMLLWNRAVLSGGTTRVSLLLYLEPAISVLGAVALLGERPTPATIVGGVLILAGVADALDSLYCHNVVAALWADAVANRLEGMAIYLLSDELAEVADDARAAARRLADRIGDLGGAITADPRQLIDRAPGEDEFTIPDCADPRAITSYALQRLNVIIAAYRTFLDTVRGRDDVSFALVVALLGAETHRRADVVAALAGQGAPA